MTDAGTIDTSDGGLDATTDVGIEVTPDVQSPDDGPTDAPVCTPGATGCAGIMPQTCDSSGHWADGTPCGAAPNATESCVAGACVLTCATGFADCNGVSTDGCEADTTKSADNCGACHHSCLGQPCSASMCEPVVLATGQTSPDAIAVNGTSVYWGNCEGSGPAGLLQVVPLAGGTSKTLETQTCVAGITLDDTNIYWLDASTPGALRRALLSGGAVTTLADNQGGPESLVSDSNHLYWSTDSTVMQVAKTGGTPTTIASGPTPRGLAVTSSSIFWANVTGGTIMTLPLSGTSASVFASAQKQPFAVATDGTNVYWSTATKIVSEPVGGGAVSTVMSGLFVVGAIVSDGANVYFTTGANVMKAPVAGGTPTVLATGSSTNAITVDGTSVYWTDVGDGTVKKTAK